MRQTLLRSLTLLSALVLFLQGCDSIATDDDSIEGIWKYDAEPGLFLDIKEREILGYEFDSDERCYDRDRVEITSRNGDEYAYRDEDGDTGRARIVRDGAQLVITEDGESYYYTRSNQTLRPICPG